jgi:phosphate transport system protein
MQNKQHIFKRFDSELKSLHGMVGDMGRLVDAQIVRAVEVLRTADLAGARDLIARDAEINDLDDRVDEELVRLIAKRQPMAGDLRELITIGKMVNDLERCGDEIRKIGRLVLQLYVDDVPPPDRALLDDLFVLIDQAATMLRRVLHAFDSGDLELALDVLGRDQRVEEAFATALERLATCIREDVGCAGPALQVTLALRGLERMGGHAKNIAGYLVFLATGEDVRHRPLDQVAKLVRGPD